MNVYMKLVVYHTALHFSAEIQTNNNSIFNILKKIYLNFEHKPNALLYETIHVSIIERDSLFHISIDNMWHIKVPTWEMAVGMVTEMIASSLALLNENWVFFHGGQAQINGKTVLIVGHSTAGKTSLLASLSLQGCETGADDVIPIVIRDGKAYTTAYPLPFFLREDILKIAINSNLCNLGRVHTFSEKTQSLEVRYLLHSRTTMRTDYLYPVSYILFPQRKADFEGECIFTRMKQAELVMELIKNSRFPQTMEANKKVAFHLAQNTIALRIEYKEAVHAVEPIICQIRECD